MRITAKGQVTIPEKIRRQEGLLPGTEVEFVRDVQGVRIAPAKSSRRKTERERLVSEAVDRLRGSATIGMTTEEIMALTRR